MKTPINVQHVLPSNDFTCFIVPSLFSVEECENLLHTDIKNSFEKAIANYPTYYRNNDRYVMDNDQLSQHLFEKVQAYLPKVIETKSSIDSENGIWHLKELNNRLRFCKYSADQYFHRHLDGIHYRDEVTQSKLTFMIYLNDATDFAGGRTLFYKTKDSTEIWASYIPQQGDLIVFDHNVWHEGEVLTQGEKFVLRSDILYQKKSATTHTKPFSGHLGYVWSVLKFDENTILSGGRDKEIKVWNREGKKTCSLEGHTSSILCIEKISDTVFISGSRDRQILVWKDFKIIQYINSHSAVVLSLCRLDNETFVSSSGDNTLKITHINGSVLQTFTEHTNWVWHVINIDNDVFASASEDGSIKVWHCHSNDSITTFTNDVAVMSIAFNQENRQLISGDLHGEISMRILDQTYQATTKITFQAHTGIIRTIKIIDDNHFATGAEDNTVKVWQTDGTLIAEFTHQNFVQSIELLDRNTLISASYDGTMKMCDINNKSHQQKP